MDQKTLYQVEKQCIQEEIPSCSSACPLHVDIRRFVRQVNLEKWNAAWKTLNKTIPFPGILGRICDHPCEDSCLLKEFGGSIRIGELEKICVSQPKPRIRVLPMPKKNYSMAVVGENLSSLVAALDLLRKGYEVTLFCSQAKLGGTLWDLPEKELPKDVLRKELKTLFSLGLQVKQTPLDRSLLTSLKENFSAVYLGLDTFDCRELIQGEVVAEKTFELQQSGFFAGGLPNKSKKISALQQSFRGRAAALSMERFVQHVSLSEGRRDEGSFPSRLFTSTQNIQPVPTIQPANKDQGYTKSEAKAEAKRCIQCQCLECLKVCPYLDHFKGYPKRYAREIYNNAAIVMGNHAANLMVNTCSLCGLCQEVCPENFSMADLCLDARRDLVERKKMPPSAHEFALQDMAFSNSELFMLSKNAPAKTKSRFAFFPGCQLSGSNPGHVVSTYSFLLNNWAEDTGLCFQCCSAPAHWAGDQEKTGEAISLLEKTWQEMGEPKMILACSSCLEMFGRYLPDIKTISLWEVMDQCTLPETADTSTGITMALHDPCTSRHQPLLHTAVRSLTDKLGITIEELEFSKKKTECCGFGGLMENANPVLAKKQLERRSAEDSHNFLTYCAMCRESLRGTGKHTAHLLDYIFPETPPSSNPAARDKVEISDSRENRARLKQNILCDIWQEKADSPVETTLHIDPHVRTKLDERRILLQDIRDAIAHAEQGGQKIQSEISDHFLACHRPLMVTFWIEYSVAETGYNVHNGYCHRMQIKGETA